MKPTHYIRVPLSHSDYETLTSEAFSQDVTPVQLASQLLAMGLDVSRCECESSTLDDGWEAEYVD